MLVKIPVQRPLLFRLSFPSQRQFNATTKFPIRGCIFPASLLLAQDTGQYFLLSFANVCLIIWGFIFQCFQIATYASFGNFIHHVNAEDNKGNLASSTLINRGNRTRRTKKTEIFHGRVASLRWNLTAFVSFCSWSGSGSVAVFSHSASVAS